MQLKFSVSYPDLTYALSGQERVAIVTSDDGRKWTVTLGRTTDGDGVLVGISDLLTWEIFIEGFRVGAAQATNPLDALREVFSKSNLSSMPEGIESKAICGAVTWVIFTMDGQTQIKTSTEFAAEVAKSTRWAYLRSAKRHEIDALVEVLKREHAAR